MEGIAYYAIVAVLVTSAIRLTEGAGPKGDIYGGTTAAKGAKTGYFYLEKIGPQWVFVTPEGNGLYPVSMAAIGLDLAMTDDGRRYVQVIEDKYRKEGDTSSIRAHERWGDNARDRLRRWGFTAIGPYCAPPAVPDFSPANSYYLDRAVPGLPANAMPYVATQANLEVPIREGVIKNIWSTTRDKHPDLDTAMFGDVFDPKFARAVRELAQAEQMSKEQLRWVLFAFIEQEDYMRGIHDDHPHLGWACAAADFEQTEGLAEPFRGLRYTYEDPKVYSKYAMRDFLRARYNTLEKLNAAWGTAYTSWESAGGWGTGTGVLDEDGRNLGDIYTPGKPEFPGIRQDLDAFAAKLMRQFYKTVYETRKEACPEMLLSTNNFGRVYPYVIQGLVSEDGKETYADLICCSDRENAVQYYQKLRRPFFAVSVYATAENDSPLGYRGTVRKIEYEDVLTDGTVVRTADPNKHPDSDVDDWKSRVIITADGVDFWWAQHPELKLPYPVSTKFASAQSLTTAAGHFTDIKWSSRPVDSIDWLSRDTFAVRQEVPFGYQALKKVLKPGDEFWRAAARSETQEQRAEAYRERALRLANLKGQNGDYVFAGFCYWGYWDSSWLGMTWDNANNFGLVTFHDNAYDGREAVWERSTDANGYPIGGERRPGHISPQRKGYGDFITGLTRTNRDILAAVMSRAKRQ